MIKTIQSYYTYTWDNIREAANRAIHALTNNRATDAINRTIKFIGEYNLGLFAFALGCACFHDYNIVIIYGVIGVIFYNQVPEIAKSVDALYQSCFLIFDPLIEHPLFDHPVLYYPLKTVIYGSIYGVGLFTYLLFKPLTSILTEAYLCIRFGAAIVAAGRRLFERRNNLEYTKEELKKLSHRKLTVLKSRLKSEISKAESKIHKIGESVIAIHSVVLTFEQKLSQLKNSLISVKNEIKSRNGGQWV